MLIWDYDGIWYTYQTQNLTAISHAGSTPASLTTK